VGDLKKKDKTPQVLFIGDFFFFFLMATFCSQRAREKMKGLARACIHKVPKNWISSFFFFSRLGWEKNGRTMSIW
jgi:hypothetical protein